MSMIHVDEVVERIQTVKERWHSSFSNQGENMNSDQSRFWMGKLRAVEEIERIFKALQ